MAMLEFNMETEDSVISRLLSQIMFKPTVSKKNIINVAAAFDTEVSSFIDEQDGEPSALVYIWMFGIDNVVVYGRTLEGFQHLIEMLKYALRQEKRKLIVYIHNMKYDYQFIKKWFDWDKVFSKDKRDIMFADTGCIEFRDSLVLAGGRSLARIGENLKNSKLRKAVGDLNYELVRHEETPLTAEELNYCEMDVRVLIEYIREKIEEDGDISKIPFTNTGYVRDYVRNACFENRENYLRLMDGLTMTPGCYQQAEQCFMGGAVGANLKHINKVVHDVTSYDIKSSYPYVMCTGYFPMSYGIPIRNRDAKDTLFHVEQDKRCCMFTLEIWGLVPKPGNDYCFPISESKCEELIGERTSYGNLDSDNMFDVYRVGGGRVITAMYLRMTCTELDFATYREFYDLDNCEWHVSEMRVFKRGWLPKPIVNSILKFFHDKTTLDGVDGKEAEYMIAKNMLNAIYGMMVEKPVRPDYYLQNGVMIKGDVDYVAKVEAYNEKWNRFLYYPWGVWVTAHARWRLYDAIRAVGKDFVYCDTDSVKLTNAEIYQDYFDKRNAESYMKMLELARRLELPRDKVIPASPKGEEKVLGTWEKEWKASRFKTLGAKRYLLEFEKGGYYLTVAGSNKKSTLEYLKLDEEHMFDNFNPHLVVPPEYSKRLVATFIEEHRSGFVTDYLGNRKYYSVLSGIHMAPTSYSFSIAEHTKRAVEFLTGERWEDNGSI